MSTSDPKNRGQNLQVASLTDLLEQQDPDMKALFVKAINLYVAPGAEELEDSVKEDRLKQAVEDSLKPL